MMETNKEEIVHVNPVGTNLPDRIGVFFDFAMGMLLQKKSALKEWRKMKKSVR
jgi:hypothetical protein